MQVMPQARSGVHDWAGGRAPHLEVLEQLVAATLGQGALLVPQRTCQGPLRLRDTGAR